MKFVAIVAVAGALKLCVTLGAYCALRAAAIRWQKRKCALVNDLLLPGNSAATFQGENRAQPWYVRLHGKIASLKGFYLK